MNETKNQLIQTGFTLDRLHQDGKIDNEAYTILNDRNKQAINYSQCCKSDSEQLKVFIDKDVDIDLVSGQKCRLLKYTEESFLIQYNHNDQIEWVGVSDLKVKNL